MVMASAPAMLRSALLRCTKTKGGADASNAVQLPSMSSRLRKLLPRCSSESRTPELAVMAAAINGRSAKITLHKPLLVPANRNSTGPGRRRRMSGGYRTRSHSGQPSFRGSVMTGPSMRKKSAGSSLAGRLQSRSKSARSSASRPDADDNTLMADISGPSSSARY